MPADSEDPHTDVQYHLEVGPDDVAETVLLPGNPERLEKIVPHWDDHEIVAHHREYRTATGTVEDADLGHLDGDRQSLRGDRSGGTRTRRL